MNYVVFGEADVRPDGIVALKGERARHVVSVLHAKAGDVVRMSRDGRGLHVAARILAISQDEGEVLVQPGEETPPPRRCGADLLLALPRPKCLKRLWPQLSAFGPRRVFICAAEKVEKSYWGCTWLRKEEREALMREGLAQAGDSIMPEVFLKRRLKPFLEDDIPALYAPQKRFFAHPGGGGGIKDFVDSVSEAETSGSVLIAVGPEGGWSAFETSMFERCGFRSVCLGRRVLRTDTAVVSLLSLASVAGVLCQEARR